MGFVLRFSLEVSHAAAILLPQADWRNLLEPEDEANTLKGRGKLREKTVLLLQFDLCDPTPYLQMATLTFSILARWSFIA
jgi:hypothetical protein